MRQSNWYGWLEKRLKDDACFDTVLLKDMPDPDRARRCHWLPFIHKELLLDDDEEARNTIAVGHSSGAEAAMRLCEDTALAGLVLVAACHTDLGEPSEQAAAWYPPSGGDWKWHDICCNTKGNIVLLHSRDDPFIPISEPRHVASQLGVELREFDGQSHFFSPSEAIVQAVYDVAKASGMNQLPN